MIAKANIIRSGALALGLLGSSLPALAAYDYEWYGGPHQTWCDINPDCNGWNRRLYGPGYQSNATGQLTPLNPKHRPVHKRSPDTKNR